MGGLFSNCFKTNNHQRDDPPPRNNNNQPPKSRVNDQDKAILDVKSRMRSLKTYVDKLNL